MTLIRPYILILILCAACALALSAPPPQLAAALDARLQQRALHGARVGMLVQSLDDGSIWYAHHAEMSFVPASNAKMLTGIMALEYLDPEFRYVTRVLTDGQIVDGTLHGDLYLQGSGDPSLRQADLQEMAHALATGDPVRHLPPIKHVLGRLQLDESFYPAAGPLRNADWERDDLPWDYAAPSSALSCEENTVTINVLGTLQRKPPCVSTLPETELFFLRNHAMTRNTAGAHPVQIVPNGTQVAINGSLAPGQLVHARISVPDPLHFTGELFRRELCKEGISVGETGIGACDEDKALRLCDHQSMPLRELLSTMLKDSNNFYAEQLRWTLLALYSREKPLNARYQYMLQDFAAHSGLQLPDIRLADGSGLSRKNLATPEAMVRLLSYMTHSPNFELFYRALPIAGVDGTLKKRLTGAPAAGNVHAKTGSMHGISTLSGYLTDSSGERLVFSIFINNCSSVAMARQVEDDIVTSLASCSVAK